MSATYERWANRLFGDKFPKVSKLDLARLPIPSVTRSKARRLSDWGAELQKRWTRLKAVTVEFHGLAALADGSGRLGAGLTRFWDVSKTDVVDIIAECLQSQPLKEREHLLERWVAARMCAEEDWTVVTALEAQVEETVAELFGLKREVYDRVISRSPIPSLNDVLLPR